MPPARFPIGAFCLDAFACRGTGPAYGFAGLKNSRFLRGSLGIFKVGRELKARGIAVGPGIIPLQPQGPPELGNRLGPAYLATSANPKLQ